MRFFKRAAHHTRSVNWIPAWATPAIDQGLDVIEETERNPGSDQRRMRVAVVRL
jgi:hypothetical protein